MPERGTPEYYAMLLLDQILIEGDDSLLHQELVQKKGYAGGVEGGINLLGNPYNYQGPMLFIADLLYDPATKPDDILSAMDSVIEPLRTKPIDQKTLDLLQSYDWPGNIRELQNVIERSIILSSTDVFSVDELWLSKRTSPQTSRVEPPAALNVEPRSEREIIEEALAQSKGRVSGTSGAAAKLRVPPSTLDSRIKALGIDKRRFKYG